MTMDRRPSFTIVAPAASPEEAAAVAAALEQFIRASAASAAGADSAPTAPPSAPRQDRWQRAALYEGVDRQPVDPLPWA